MMMRRLGAALVMVVGSLYAQDEDYSDYFVIRNSGDDANVRSCPYFHCDVVYTLPSFLPLKGNAFVLGDPVNGDRRWLEFHFKGELLYVHASLVEAAYTASETEQWEAVEFTPATQNNTHVIYHESGQVNLRACPRLDCAVVATGQNWQEIEVMETVEGEYVFGSSEWRRFMIEDRETYIHSWLATPADPGPFSTLDESHWSVELFENEDAEVHAVTFTNRFINTGNYARVINHDLVIRCGNPRDDGKMAILVHWERLVSGRSGQTVWGRMAWGTNGSRLDQQWIIGNTGFWSVLPEEDNRRFLRNLFTHSSLRVILKRPNGSNSLEEWWRLPGLMPLISQHTEICGLS